MVTMTAMSEFVNAWYPTYLQEARGASQDLSGRLTTLVLVPGAFAAFFGGLLTDWLVRRQETGGGAERPRPSWDAESPPSVSWRVSGPTRPWLRPGFISLVAFGVQLQLPAWWA